MDSEQSVACWDGGNESVKELQRKLEEAERKNNELRTSLNMVLARSQQWLEKPLNREAYQRELLKKFASFVENRLRFHSALQRICDECISARKQTNVVTIGVGTVGFVAAFIRSAKVLGPMVSVAAAAFNTSLAVKNKFDEAARIKQLQSLEETDLKLIGQLLNSYDEFCTLFKIEKRIGGEDVMRLQMSEVVSSMVKFVEGVDSASLLAGTGTADPRTVIEYACRNAVFPLLANLASSTLPDSFDVLQNVAGVSALSLSADSSASVLQFIANVVNGFCALNALADLINGSESEAVKRMKFFVDHQKHELALFQSAVNDASQSE
ncbi:hypothetical protein Tcan_18367 [Toxocara canis]|uniref:Uncharacterized protein n=2 Tax=Toxocara canis TaxID=6265 RepID=A0A0B2V8P0_TOXCA|nr:hypothetical protein Tcan_18367 [Toxocara canis]VDM42969.1 unnamed protein product [Toxocara canis]